MLILLIFAGRRLENSRVGRAWLAIREDEDAAAVMGVHAFKFKLWAFAIGAALGGHRRAAVREQAGVRRTRPASTLNLSFLFVAMVVIGGSGNMSASCSAPSSITYLPERFREFPTAGPLAFGVGAGRW